MMVTTSGNGFSLHNLRCRADKIMMGLLWGLFAYSLVLANWHGTWSEALFIGLPSALVPSLVIFLMAGSFISRAAVGTAFMIFAALTIHQAHGMVEMHFLIFVLLAFMLAYRDWVVVVLSAAVIAVHHLAFSFLQASGEGVYLFSGEASIMLVVIHAAFVVFETAILVHFSVQGKREALQTEEIHAIGSHLQVTDGVVDLVYRVPEAKSTFAHQFNAFMAHLHDTVKKLSSANTELLQATEIMTQVANDTSVSARQQESDISQVATAINEMTATVQEVANTTTMAADAADSANAETINGRKVVTETVASIHGLADEIERISDVVNRVNSNSDEIGSVLDVIREIAEQTNLLALNAAIEAARAGEQGRGFAVVADEVRVLASRTQASTQEIQATIGRLQEGTADAVQTMEQGRERVQRSVEQASAAGVSLGTIADSVTTINDMNRQIASAVEEQSSVAEEINKSVVKINQVAEKTVATGVKLTGATGLLDALAGVLKKEASKFHI